MKKLLVSFAVVMMAVMMVGCGGSNAASSANASSSGNNVAPVESSSSSAAATAGDITVNVDLKESVTQSTTQNTALQFSEEQQDVNVADGASALDALQAMGREVETSGSGDSVEVTSIGGLANGAAGEGSHWELSINGQTMNASPAVCTLSNGDSVVFYFVQ